MQSSWRLREQKRREEAEAEERRRAVEKSEISFPSLGNTNTGWDVPKTNETKTAAAQRWSEGDVVRSAPRSAAVPSGGAGKPAAVSAPMGVHARIASEVRRQTAAESAASWRSEDEDDCGGAGRESDGWTEVSKTKTKKKSTAAPQPPPPSQQEYDDYDDYEHESDY
jgi:hypothetical protein